MKYTIFFLIFHTTVFGISSIGTEAYSRDQKRVTIFKQVMEQNQPSLSFAEEEWPDEDYKSYILRCMKYQAELNENKKRHTVFKMFDTCELKKQFTGNLIYNDQTSWQDLNLFCGQADVTNYLASIIDRTRTSFGRALLYSMLVNPTDSIKELERRQGIIRHLLDNPVVLERLDTGLRNLQQSENIMLSFWCDDTIRQEVKKNCYLHWPIKGLNDFVNKSETNLAILNMISHVESMINFKDYIFGGLFVSTYYGLKLIDAQTNSTLEDLATGLQQDKGINGGSILSDIAPWVNWSTGKNIFGLLAGLHAAMNVKEWALWTRDQFVLDSLLHIKIMYAAQCLDGMRELERTVSLSSELKNGVFLSQSLNEFLDPCVKKAADVEQLLKVLAHRSFKDEPSFLMHKGRMLLAYKLMHENKGAFEDAFAAVGEIDAYVSLAKLYKEHEKTRVGYCFATFIESNKPVLAIKEFWNPFVDREMVIPNNVVLGEGDYNGNIIITGPNAGGKSTILKAVAIEVLMAQSFGIAPAREITLTPFSKITTYLNIRDDIGAGNSLFKAQVLRAQELLEYVKSLTKGKFCFVIIDEMFNGTSPKEAEAAAYSIAKNLGENPSAMCLIATHFPLLTHLEKDKGTFSNYSVRVEHLPDGTICYPFELKQGISHQHVALDMLKAEGFSGAILDDAHAIINKPQ